MTDYKFLSRKFILSVLLFVVATWFLSIDILAGFQWQIVLMATALTYLGGKSLEKAKANNVDPVVSFWDRIVSLFSREFLISLGIFILATILAYTHKISGDIWFQIVTVIGSTYNVFNSMSK